MPLDPEELAEVRAVLEAEAALGEPAETSVKIYRLLRYYPYVLAAILTAIAFQLGSYAAAAPFVAGTVLFAVLRPKRVNRYRFDDSGRLFLDDRPQPLDWQQVARLTVRHWAPPLTPDTRLTRHQRSLDVRLDLVDGRTIRFARGEHFHVTPPRRPVTPGRFESWLRQRAHQAGLTIESHGDYLWTAHRPHGSRRPHG